MHEDTEDISLKKYFFPLTRIKAIHFIILIGFLVFANCLFNGFVWDDKIFIINNPEVHTFNILKLFQRNMFNSLEFYRPLPAVYFAFVYSLFGTHSFFYHFLQVLLHLICTSVFFIFLTSFFSTGLAFFLSLVFLVHPINVESVVFIGATQSELYFLPGMIALLLAQKEEITFLRLSWITTLLLISLLTKETGILFLILVISYRFLFKKKKKLKEFVMSGALIGLIYMILRVFVGQVVYKKFIFTAITQMSLPQRLINIPGIFIYYLKTFLFPLKLAIYQSWAIEKITLYGFVLPLIFMSIFIIFLLFLIFKERQKNNNSQQVKKEKNFSFKELIFFTIWFMTGMGILLQIVPLDMTVADRWFYFPMAGLLGILGIILEKHVKKAKNRKIFIFLGAIIIVLLSVRTIIRNSNWKDAITLYTHDVRINKFEELENYLGYEYAYINQYEEARVHFERAVKLRHFEGYLNNLGLMYVKLNDQEKAIKYLSEALNSKNSILMNQGHLHEPDTYKSLSWQLMRKKMYSKALQVLQKGLSDYPIDASIWEYMALTQYGLKNQNEAEKAIQKAIKIIPLQEYTNIYMLIKNKQPINLGPGI